MSDDDTSHEAADASNKSDDDKSQQEIYTLHVRINVTFEAYKEAHNKNG